MPHSSTRTALVTGVAHGLGQAIARRLVHEGFKVVWVHRPDEKPLPASEEGDGIGPSTLHFESADLRDPQGVAALFERLQASSLEPDVLVHASELDATDGSQVDEAALSKWRSALLTAQRALQGMTTRRFGRIVTVCAPGTHLALPGEAVSASSTAAVLGFTRSLAREVASFGVTVNAVTPGWLRTDPADSKAAARAQNVPLRRLGTPEDVAGMVSMLCADAASYITGQCLAVDGGVS